MSGKIDPINSRNYGAITANLIVKDLNAAVSFYKNAFGFAERGGVMNGPDGKPVHAELRLRDSTLMLSPENPARGMKSASTMGGSPITLYMLTEDVDATVARAVKLGARADGQVMDMFWGDRSGTVVDPNGYSWMISTHVAEPTEQEMKKKMAEQMGAQASGAVGS